MDGYGPLISVLALVAVTVVLSTRPARGPGSIDATPLLQAAVLACCLAWGAVTGFGSLLLTVIAMWDRGEPPLWPFVAVGIVTAAVCLAWLGRPWGPLPGDVAGADDSAGVELNGERS